MKQVTWMIRLNVWSKVDVAMGHHDLGSYPKQRNRLQAIDSMFHGIIETLNVLEATDDYAALGIRQS